jgi:ferritin-like metal-binding protein YciE
MADRTLEEQLTKYLTDAHSIEQQALAQLKKAPEIAGDPALASVFAKHLAETEEHEQLVRGRLEAHGASPSKVKDVVGALTGKGFVAFARSQPDTPGKLVAHSFSYEHMEFAAYDLLARVAERAGDEETAEVARRIRDQERAMGERLASLFDQAVEASLAEVRPDDLQHQLDKYLADAHAIEAQAIQLLKKAPNLAGSGDLAAAYEEHLAETEEHRRLIEDRLEARGEAPSKIKDAVLRVGALNWGMFFQAQPDTPAKLAAFAYAFEHLEIASYSLLRRVAQRAGDHDTAQVAERILGQEHSAAERIHSLFDQALEASLQEQRVGAR